MNTFALALKNLWNKKLRSILNITAVTMAICTSFIFLALSQGIKTNTLESAVKQSPLTQIKVFPQPKEASVFALFSQKINLLHEEDVQKISQLPHVVKVHTESQYRNIASVEMSVLGQNFITDAMILGVPYELIKDDVSGDVDWENPQEPYPIIIPNQIIQLYNYAIANSSHLPAIKKDFLIGKEISIHLNYSAFFPEQQAKKETLRAVIVGASDKVNMFGISIPDSLIHKWNKDLYSDYQKMYLQLYVETDAPENNSVLATEIEKLGYETRYVQKDIEAIEQNFFYLKLVVFIISLIITLTAGISITNTFFSAITERKREIGVLRALGATPRHILTLFIQEASLIGLISGLIGTMLGFLSTQIIDIILLPKTSDLGLEINSIFSSSPLMFMQLIFFAVIISVIAAVLPAAQAAKLNPVEALRA